VNGEVVIVTWAARVLGRSYALGLAGNGYAVVVADIADPGPVVDEIENAGGTALGLPVDVSDPDSTRELADRTLERFGRIDLLVNNAGYMTDILKQPFEEISPAEWDHCMAVNVRGTWLCCRAVVPTMKRQRSGKIVNTSSATVPSGVPGFLHYVSSKAAIVGLTRALARERVEHQGEHDQPRLHPARLRLPRPTTRDGLAHTRAALPEARRDAGGRGRNDSLPRRSRLGLRHRPGLLGERRPALPLMRIR
jgi:NAD(P)-dependent dehydrogenase (short-subunit alcohol dehydrogenase family)